MSKRLPVLRCAVAARICILILAAAGSLEASVCSTRLFSWVSGSPMITEFDPYGGYPFSVVPVIVGGVQAPVHALAGAWNGELYGLVDLGIVAESSLVQIDLNTGEATLIGATGQVFATLAIDVDGNMWATTAESGPTPESLYQIDPATGASTFLCALTPGDTGEFLTAITFDYPLIRVSGTAGVFDPMTGLGTTFETLPGVFSALPCQGAPFPLAPELLTDDCAGLVSLGSGDLLWKVGSGPGFAYRLDPYTGDLVDFMFIDATTSGLAAVPFCSSQPFFTRGDANTDTVVNIADSIYILGVLFTGFPSTCQAAEDVNGDGITNIADPIYLFGTLFSNGPQPPPPYPLCGFDPLGLATCDQPPFCP